MAILGGVPLLDFSTIGKLPDVYKKAQMEQARNRTLADLGQGATVAAVARRLFQAGDIEGGLSLAKLADARALREYEMKRDTRDFELKDKDYKLREKQLDATITGGKIEPGFEAAPGGGVRPVPGGSKDPAYIKSTTEAKDKNKPLPHGTVTSIGDAGTSFTNFDRLTNTFHDNFGGKKMSVVGEVQNVIGRNIEAAPDAYKQQAQWWQDYQEQKNIIRNKLFGSALTATERSEFDKAAIAPGMTAATIRANLERQREASKRAAAKMAGYYVNIGYDPDHIEAALGVPLDQLGIKRTTKRPAAASTGAPATPAAPPAAPAATAPAAQARQPVRIKGDADYNALQSGDQYIDPEGNLRTKR